MEMTLFAKVAVLLTGTMILGALGALTGRAIRSIGAFIGLAILFVVGTIAVILVAKANAMLGICLLGGWAYLSGLVIAPSVQMYAEKLGWQTVFGAYLGTAGVMAVCGAVAMLSGINFGALGGILFFALLGLIVVGIVGIFVRMSREFNMIYAGLGMVIFAGYFLFDFFRLGHTENTWARAVELTVSIYLDFLNFFLYLLQFIAAVSDKN
jgi:Integral membrane protein, interacts with FtsH